jgi:phage terminase small subunit
MDKLTAKQEKFCQEYIIDLNATNAAIRAGYSVKAAHVTSSRLLRNAKVMHIIAKKRQVIAEKTEINAENILNSLIQIREKCQEEDDRGKIDSSGALKANELLGKHIGMFTQKIEASIVDGTKKAEVKAMFDSMSTEEKLEWLSRRDA